MNPLDAFERILQSVYRAALDDAHWPAAASLIEEAAGATGNLLAVGEVSGDGSRVRFVQQLYRGEPRPDLTQKYYQLYYRHDEAPPRLRERPSGQLIHVPDLYTEVELRRSVAYNEGWRAARIQNGLITRLDEPDGLHLVWTLGDPLDGGGWQSAQVQLVESLLPHVRQFVRFRQALVAADGLSAGLTGLLDNSRIGVLHLDRGGRVLAANDAAVDILRLHKGLSDCGGALRASLPADDSRLQKLLKRALPVFGSSTPPTGGWMRIQRPRLRSRLELHVHPVDAGSADFGGRRVAALVLVVDPESGPRIDPARVATLLGLSPSEGKVSALLAEGRSVREIAAITGFKETYVRWLLQQTYKKLEISGHGALVGRVLTAYAFPWR
ncbi:MAG: helix-turn-helix transcriptional regulator [Acidobacteria bacterium]|nr:helix-turn-helix transcriptional regulator [Acidobacteriota bacterium]